MWKGGREESSPSYLRRYRTRASSIRPLRSITGRRRSSLLGSEQMEGSSSMARQHRGNCLSATSSVQVSLEPSFRHASSIIGDSSNREGVILSAFLSIIRVSLSTGALDISAARSAHLSFLTAHTVS